MKLRPMQLLLASLAIAALGALCGSTALAQGTGSMDYQGPTRLTPDGFGTGLLMTEGDILTPSTGGPPIGLLAFNAPPPGIAQMPGPISLTAAALGIVPTAPPGGYVELDALSYGRDLFPEEAPIVFSVDEFASGIVNSPAWPNVFSEGAMAGMSNEASADIYLERGAPRFMNPLPTLPWPPFPPGTGNGILVDGNGNIPPGGIGPPFVPGIGLVEPNPPAQGVPDQGDNLDAIDVDTTPRDLQGPVFFSLDSSFADPLEVAIGAGPPPNTGTAAANNFVGGDVLVQFAPGAAPPPIAVFATAWQLGLDGAATPANTADDIPDSDDLDALILSRMAANGGPDFDPLGGDVLLFSVRRGSAIIGTPDSMLNIPIEEGDILAPPGVFGVPGPAPGIFVAAEWLGLATVRSGTAGQFGDDLDALDTVPEPSTVVMLGLSLLCLAGYVRRRQRRAA